MQYIVYMGHSKLWTEHFILFGPTLVHEKVLLVPFIVGNERAILRKEQFVRTAVQ